MDGRAVDTAVREIVRPSLKNAGFTKFTGRKAWRFQPATIELVTFRSFTSHIAAGVGCTTFSFAVTAGVWYRCLDVDLVKPEDYDLTFSFELGKTLRQPWFSYEGSAKRWDRPDVWYLLPDGSNLVESVRDAAAVLVASGLPLLDRFAVPELAYRALLTQTSRNPDFGVPGMAMPGAPDSPRWRDTDEASPFALRSTRNRPRRAMRRGAADPTQSAFQPTAFVEPQEQPSPMSCASCQAAARKRIRA